jgi:hypothetical protein
MSPKSKMFDAARPVSEAGGDRPAPRLLMCGALVLLLSLAGCRSLVHEVEKNGDRMAAWWSSTAQKPEQLTDQTWDLLRYWDLETRYLEKPEATVAYAAQMFYERPEREWAYALAELSFLAGKRKEAHTPAEAGEHYLNALSYAYYFLFGEPAASHEFDRRNAYACQLYNAGLECCIRLSSKEGGLDPQHELRLDGKRGVLTAAVSHHGFKWQPQEFNELVVARDFSEPERINHQTVFGLGVPLIGVRHNRLTGDERERFLVKHHPFAVTAFFRPDLSRILPLTPEIAKISATAPARLDQTAAAQNCGSLELCDPLRFSNVQVAGRNVPLEIDLAAPMSYVLASTETTRVEWSGFFDPERIQKYSGLYMIEPMQPDKIPVVFVHGLLSGPVTWTEMFQELWNDPLIRERYQFWFFLYPTGSSFLDTARQLRGELQEVLATYGPQHPAIDQTVLIGHSMGGLLSKLQVTSSDDQLWQLVSKVPLDRIKADPATRAKLQQTFFFEPQPSIKRVVFIGTPHQGSELSRAPIGRIGSLLVQAPEKVKHMQWQLVRDNPGRLNPGLSSSVPTSIDLLAPQNPVLQTMYRLPFEANLKVHSIVGTLNENVIGRSAVAEFLTGYHHQEGDGVVSLTSAHLPNADSEYRVPATHEKVHRHPLTFLEVRRILRQHLEDVVPSQSIQPLEGEGGEFQPPVTPLSKAWKPAPTVHAAK